ncbi:DUF1796 family putative cysteine peptidase [Paenibacillus alginolyticus]|uniref:Papain-like cysteine peptidase n=1 Tax=Paenibacillus alginolyticus TaxID=59839 RepID=A0ABT4GDV7_9BACL|nr:DUF1796 family putative cysteine peptidase [Paenibacillus alginolyticus]MCY9694370.1 papain-like cysteine peptidase [Paenibacillus alginolyticus]MEC0147539.1 DUF1796 family putative cysteine peptidase [Paenibacillus alginolyticus]
MRLADIKGSYDAILSLGDLCAPSIQLEKHKLRPYSGVLDWMGSHNLSDVNRLLRNRFHGFMELANLKVIGHASEKIFLVVDEAYNIASNHDFYVARNKASHLSTYPEVKAKYDRRVARFIEKTSTCKKILFIRTGGTPDQVVELQSVLSELVKHDFNVLFVEHTNVSGIVETHWPIPKVCSIQLPNHNFLFGNDHLWSQILHDIHLHEYC